jgi:putative hydrolase of the HAD superfamily
MLTSPKDISSLVFDLDGTLYICPPVVDEIQRAAEILVADSRGISRAGARDLIRCAKKRLTEILEEEPTLTRTCMELGIDVPEFHRALQRGVHPEKYLSPDPVLAALLDSLRDHCDLYVFTNNSLPLARKILALLGVEDQFRKLYTIEFSWTPKPDPEAFRRVLEDIGGTPQSFLFVGDRRQVDLKIPDSLGIPTLLVNETSDILQIHKFLGIIP